MLVGSMAVSVASALMSSRFDHAISVLSYRSSSASTTCTCYRGVTQQRSGSSSPTSTELLKQLHWLPIDWRIRFKLATLTFKALHTGHPPYLADLLQYHKPTKFTLSSASHLLSVPRHNLSFGSRAFRISAPTIWNYLPPHILQSQTLDSFRLHLKTYYFQSAYLAPSAHPVPNALWFSSETLASLALYKSLTYLLTYLLTYNTR